MSLPYCKHFESDLKLSFDFSAAVPNPGVSFIHRLGELVQTEREERNEHY